MLLDRAFSGGEAAHYGRHNAAASRNGNMTRSDIDALEKHPTDSS